MGVEHAGSRGIPARGDLGDDAVLVGPALGEVELILDRIDRNIADRPTSVAVECGAQRLTWSEVAERADRIADSLLARGVTLGDRVVVSLPRSVDLVPAIVAVLGIGAVYVPVDPSQPPERVDRLVEACRASVAVVAPDSPVSVASTVLIGPGEAGRDRVVPRSRGDETMGPRKRPSSDDVAYIIFTSGSTGAPRGVPVSHGRLAASTTARAQVYDADPTRFLMVSSIGFDSSIVGLFWTMAVGGTIVLPDERTVHDVDRLAAMVKECGPSHLLCVPSLYRALLQRRDPGESAWADHVIVAGEACSPSLVRDHFAAVPSSRLTNEYGPTEATVWATAHHCVANDDPVPIGTPIPGTWVLVENETGRLAEPGTIGELVIGGANVTAGYLDDREATATKFGVEHAEASKRGLSGRFYRTGDRARIVDGRLFFEGRTDDQLNVGGTRIEPGEIEQALMSVRGVEMAVVVAHDPRSLDDLLDAAPDAEVRRLLADAAGSSDPAAMLLDGLRRLDSSRARLVAHIAGEDDLDLTRVRARANELLAVPARPLHYVLHQDLPRLPNGKVDRKAAAELPLGDHAAFGGDVAANAVHDPTDVAGRVAQVMAGLLGGGTLGADDSFVDHGGHSLLLVELVVMLEDEFGVSLPGSSIFDDPTPSVIARHIAEARGDDTVIPTQSYRSLVNRIQPLGDLPPLFAIHNLGVDCEYWRPLAAELGTDQPLIGLGAPHKIEKFGRTAYDPNEAYEIDEIAAAYVGEIERLVPDGEVSVVGLCGGAVPAYEVAQQLRSRGRRVRLLAIINDWHAPYAERAIDDIGEPGGRREAFRSRMAVARSLGLGWIRWVLTESVQAGRIRRRAEIVALSAATRFGLALSHRLRVRQYIERGLEALHTYDYRPYDGPIAIYRGASDPSHAGSHPGSGWGDLLTDATFTVTPGSGNQMMYPPNVAELAQALRRDLARAGRELTVNEVETKLVAAAHDATLPTRLGSWVESGRIDDRELCGDALDLVQRTDAVCRAVAASNRAAARWAVSRLADHGIGATPAPHPARMMHHFAVVATSADASEVRAALTELGYQPAAPAPAAVGTRDASARDFLRVDPGSSLRLRIIDARSADQADGDEVLSGGAAAAASGSLGGFLGTPTGLIAPLLRFGDVQPDEVVLDLGCGDGRVLIEAALGFGARGIGVESDPALAAVARREVARAGVEDRVRIVEADVNSAEDLVAEADVLFAFLPPSGANEVVTKLRPRMAPGARLIAHELLPVDWGEAPETVELVLSSPTGAEETEPGLTVASRWCAASG